MKQEKQSPEHIDFGEDDGGNDDVMFEEDHHVEEEVSTRAFVVFIMATYFESVG